jgi:hypothetical protein
MTELAETCHKKLKLPVLFKPIDFGLDPCHPIIEYPLIPKLIAREIHNWLATFDIEIATSRYFHNPPHARYKLHVDSQKAGPNQTFLNFVFGGAGSFMSWYKLLPGKTHFEFTNTKGTQVYGYNENDCEQIFTAPCWSAEEGYANLVNAGIIHTMTNFDSPRTCYSLKLTKNKIVLDWNDLVDIFDSYIME